MRPEGVEDYVEREQAEYRTKISQPLGQGDFEGKYLADERRRRKATASEETGIYTKISQPERKGKGL